MNHNQKLELIQPGVLIMGMDMAKRTHWVQPMLHNGMSVGKAFSFKNNKEGFESLLAKIEVLKEANRCHTVIFGLEPTGHYWRPLARYLIAHNYQVVLVNPYHVKKSKELDDNTQTKNDRKDSRIIGRLVIQGHFFETYFPTGVWAELRELSRTRSQIKARNNASLNQIRAILDEYFPEYETVFRTLTGKASMHVLSHSPMPAELRQLGEDGIIAEIRNGVKKGVGPKKAKLLYYAAVNTIGLPATQAVRRKLTMLLDSLRQLQDQLESMEEEMEKQLHATGIGPYILSIPGVGVVTATGFLGEIGDPGRFTSWKQIRKLSGYNLVEQSSGERQGRRTISKRGRSALRNHLYQMALMVACKNEPFKQLYRHLLHRNQNPLKKKQALVVVAMKLLRVIWILITKKECYDPSKVLGDYRNQQLKAA